jgi:hypothetical protein
MNNSQVALAVGTGYLLGRMRKKRLMLTLAGLAAGKRLSGTDMAGELLKGAPGVGGLADNVREQLLSAGKRAAVAAASSRIDELSDRLQSRAASLRTRPGKAEQAAEEPPEEPEEEELDEEELPEEEAEAAEEPEEEEEAAPPPRRRSAPGRERVEAKKKGAAKRAEEAPAKKTASAVAGGRATKKAAEAPAKKAAARSIKKTAAGGPARRGRG